MAAGLNARTGSGYLESVRKGGMNRGERHPFRGLLTRGRDQFIFLFIAFSGGFPQVPVFKKTGTPRS